MSEGNDVIFLVDRLDKREKEAKEKLGRLITEEFELERKIDRFENIRVKIATRIREKIEKQYDVDKLSIYFDEKDGEIILDGDTGILLSQDIKNDIKNYKKISEAILRFRHELDIINSKIKELVKDIT